MNFVEPSGDTRLDLLFAMLQETIANNSMGRTRAVHMEQYLLEKRMKPRDGTDESRPNVTLKEELSGFAQSWNARITSPGR